MWPPRTMRSSFAERRARAVSLAIGALLLAMAALAAGPVAGEAIAPGAPAGQIGGEVDRARTERLDALFARLADKTMPANAHAAAREIWAVWLTSGREDIDELMGLVVKAMRERRLDEALSFLDHMVQHAPAYAEGWNKRATVHYMLGSFDDSLADIERTLALEPRHFGAITGIALIRLARGENAAAVVALRRALAIYPALPDAANILQEAGEGASQDPT